MTEPSMPRERPLSTPNPDPTTLTTTQLYREVEALRERFEDRLSSAALRESTGFANVLRELERRFETAESSRIEQKADTKAAVDAALSAAKEAVKEQTTASERSIAKSEAATAKQREQQQLTTTTALQSLRTSIDEMKERSIEDVRVLRQGINDSMALANAINSQKVGAGEQRQEHTDNRVAIYTTVGLVVSLVIAAIAIVGFIVAEAGRA